MQDITIKVYIEKSELTNVVGWDVKRKQRYKE